MWGAVFSSFRGTCLFVQGLISSFRIQNAGFRVYFDLKFRVCLEVRGTLQLLLTGPV